MVVAFSKTCAEQTNKEAEGRAREEALWCGEHVGASRACVGELRKSGQEMDKVHFADHLSKGRPRLCSFRRLLAEKVGKFFCKASGKIAQLIAKTRSISIKQLSIVAWAQTLTSDG